MEWSERKEGRATGFVLTRITLVKWTQVGQRVDDVYTRVHICVARTTYTCRPAAEWMSALLPHGLRAGLTNTLQYIAS